MASWRGAARTTGTRAAVCAETVTIAFGRPKAASIAGPSRCMKAPAAPGSSAIIGEPWETKIGGSEEVMRHWITGAGASDSTALHTAFATRVPSRTMTTPSLTHPAPLDAASAPPLPAPSAWQLGWRQLLRDFRAGELRLLVVAVTLAVAALTAVGFFADRINGGLARDARQLLGGDAIVSTDQPTPASFVERARAIGLLTATTANFPSMGRAPDEKGGATRLVSVKSVSDAYPLRGKLRVRDAAGAKEVDVAAAPARGTAWVDAAILDSLGLA